MDVFVVVEVVMFFLFPLWYTLYMCTLHYFHDITLYLYKWCTKRCIYMYGIDYEANMWTPALRTAFITVVILSFSCGSACLIHVDDKISLSHFFVKKIRASLLFVWQDSGLRELDVYLLTKHNSVARLSQNTCSAPLQAVWHVYYTIITILSSLTILVSLGFDV